MMTTTEFMRDFRAAPVPIRMSCPFTNGITLTYFARAVSCNNRLIRISSVNPFEHGIQLVVAAPFLDGSARCSVAGVKRSRNTASYFEIELRFIDPPVFIRSMGTESGLYQNEFPVLADNIAAMARRLANGLESSLGIPFAKALRQTRPQDDHLALLATISAVLLLVEERGLSDTEFTARQIQRPSPWDQAGAFMALDGGISKDRQAV